MLWDPVTELNMVAEVDYFRLARDRYFVPISVKIPGSELVLAKKGGAEKTVIDFVGQITDAKTGKTVQNVRDIADIKLKGEQLHELVDSPWDTTVRFSCRGRQLTRQLLAPTERHNTGNDTTPYCLLFPSLSKNHMAYYTSGHTSVH